MDEQGLHQLLHPLFSVKTNRVEIGRFGRLKLASGGRVVGFGLATHSLTVTFMEHLAVIQGFPDQRVTSA
jgi:hypothetical protein